MYEIAGGQLVKNILFAAAGFGLAHVAFQWMTWAGWLLWTPLAAVVLLEVAEVVGETALGAVSLIRWRQLTAERRAELRGTWGVHLVGIVQSVILVAAAYLSVRSFV